MLLLFITGKIFTKINPYYIFRYGTFFLSNQLGGVGVNIVLFPKYNGQPLTVFGETF